MKSVFSYLIVFCAIIFWAFRVVVCFMYSMKKEFLCIPLNLNIEIAILFLTIIFMIFIVRRNFVATTFYFGMYAAYFGGSIFENFAATKEQVLAIANSLSLTMNFLGVLIPCLVFLDVAIQKMNYHPKDGKTDWYYDNEKFDVKYDERADRNQYKIK